MSIPIKNAEEIELIRKSGQILATVLNETAKKAVAGISTKELDLFAENLIRELGGTPAFKGFHGYPATLCTNINEVIVHGIPREEDIIREGDLVTIDCGVNYSGLLTDAARSLTIGKTDKTRQKLLKTANETLSKAIDLIRPGIHIGEISKLIQTEVEKAGFHIIYDLTGHGIGHEMHEEPVILNYFDGNPGPSLKPGMTICVEPIFSSSTNKMTTLSDGWTIKTPDNSSSVQVEHTILITEKGCEVLTA